MAYRLTLVVITVFFMQKSCSAQTTVISELSSSMSESATMMVSESTTATPVVTPTTSTTSSGSTTASAGASASASESTSVSESITPTPTQSTSQAASPSVSYGVYTAWNVTCKEAGCCDESNVGLTPLKYTQHRQCNPGNCQSDGYNMTKTTPCPEKTSDCTLCSNSGAGSVEPIFFPMALSLIMALFTYIFA